MQLFQIFWLIYLFVRKAHGKLVGRVGNVKTVIVNFKEAEFT